jgi:hypothetical protein
MLIVALLVIAGFAFYVMTGEERDRVMRPVGVFLHRAAILCLAGLRRLVIALLARNRWAFGGLAAAGVLVLAVGMHARHLQTFTDIRPELTRVVTIEEKTTQTYDAAVQQFKLGAMSADALSRVIRRRVLPELSGTRLRLKSLDRVPSAHQHQLAEADEYLQLRCESWRLRAEALEKRSMTALKKADQATLVSMKAFERVRDIELP